MQEHDWQSYTWESPYGDRIPVSRCRHCGLLRKQWGGDWYYDMPAVSWRMIAEPPCTPERPAKAVQRP